MLNVVNSLLSPTAPPAGGVVLLVSPTKPGGRGGQANGLRNLSLGVHAQAGLLLISVEASVAKVLGRDWRSHNGMLQFCGEGI
jgi:hypothetical protein